MTSELKSATSRANGAKSHGPTTADGRKKSSQNSLNHGFTSKKTILLKCENEGEFQIMLGDYTTTYQPGSPVEEDLVTEMVACRWRMQRLRVIETALMDSEMQRELPEEETTADPGYQMAFAFRRLVDGSRAISLASRYESRLHRIHEQSHRTLRELQNNPSVSAGTLRTPTPAPEELPAKLEQILGLGRNSWPLATIRQLADVFLEAASGRKKSPAFEVRWLNLCGFCWRPGLGFPGDDFRLEQARRVYSAGVQFPNQVQCEIEWWIFWGRVAGGLNRNQQADIYQRLAALLMRVRDEDALMAEEFPDAHRTYRTRTKALIPFVW